MPEVIWKGLDDGAQVSVWEIDEEYDFFLQELGWKAKELSGWSLKSRSRKLEWLASRFLVKKLTNAGQDFQIGKTKFGKPYLPETKTNISFSHSCKFVAAIAGPSQCGIDIQIRTGRLQKLTFKFLNNAERRLLESKKSEEVLHLIWGAKEALYKYYGTQDLFFKKDILITDIELKFIKAKVHRYGKWINHDLSFEWVDERLLVYTRN